MAIGIIKELVFPPASPLLPSDLTDLRKLYYRGKLLATELTEHTDAYNAVFQAACKRAGLDPEKTSLDIETGLVVS